jgi:hyperosmotically inducible protein
MKKTLKMAAFALLISAVAVSCKKKVEETPAPAPVAVETPAPTVVETVSAVAPEVQQKVADAVKDFPGVKVEVVNNELTLTGTVSPEQARKIKMSVDALKVGKVNFNYTVK